MDNATAPRVAILSGTMQDIPSEIMEQVSRFRYKIFYERLNWNVNHHGGIETDQYDHNNTLNTVAMVNGCVVGIMRFLPTTGPYMLDEIFPILFNGEAPPHDPSVWEISRFSVDNTVDPGISNREVFFRMIRYARNTWAYEVGLRELVMATTAPVEGIVKHRKLPISRFGNGDSHMIDGVESVGCRLLINEQFDSKIRSQKEK